MIIELCFLRPFGKYSKGATVQIPLSGYTKELVRRKIAQVVEVEAPELPPIPEKKAVIPREGGRRR